MKKIFWGILTYLFYYMPGIATTSLLVYAFIRESTALYIIAIVVDIVLALILDNEYEWGGKHFAFWTFETLVLEISGVIFIRFNSIFSLYFGILIGYFMLARFESEIVSKVKFLAAKMEEE